MKINRIGVNTLFMIPGDVGGSETYLRKTLQAMAMNFPGIPLILFTSLDNDALLRADLEEYSQIEFLTSGIDITEDTWIYFAKKTNHPCQSQPIAQSYVDVIIKGCLEIGLEYTEEFLKTTAGWEYPWIDDRMFPRYPRHLDYEKHCPKTDQIIQQSMPELFNHRVALYN